MELCVPTLSSYHPGLPDKLDERVGALDYSSDQAVTYMDNNISSNSTRILGATKERKDSDTFNCSTIDFAEEIPRSDKILTDDSSPNNSLSSILLTSSNERSQSLASCPSTRSEGIWPDKVEEAFQKAWRICPLQGRDKILSDTRVTCKNQWISAYINKKTGVYRTRKQIASHIQTLKKKKGAKDPARKAPKARIIVSNNEIQTEDNGSDLKETASFEDGANIDNPVNNQNTSTTPLVDNHSLLPPQPEITSATPHLPHLHRTKFSMCLLDEAGKKVHVFSSMQKEIEPAPKELVDIYDGSIKCPPLAEFHRQEQTNTSMFLLEACMNVKDDLPKHNLCFAVEITIEFAKRMAYGKWMSSTRVYEESGNEVDLSKAKHRSGPNDGPWESLEYLKPPQTIPTKLKIPLKSKWWAHTLPKVISKQYGAEKSADPVHISQEDETTRRYIEGISVVQEIWAVPRGTNLPRQRMAIFMWNFNQTQRANTAAASWRKIHSPITPSSQTQPLPFYFQNLPTTQIALGAAIRPSSVPTIPARLGLHDCTLANNAESLPETSQAPTYADVSSSYASTPVFHCVPHGASASHPPQEPFLQKSYSETFSSAPLVSWQSVHEGVYRQESFGLPDSNPSDSQDITWFTSNPFEGNPISPWQPQAGNFGESQDMSWSTSNPFDGDLFLPLQEP